MNIRINNKLKVIPYVVALYALTPFFFWGVPRDVSGGENETTQGDLIGLLESAYKEVKEKGGGSVNIGLEEIPETVQAGDLVFVDYILTLESGEILRTNIPALADDSTYKKAEEYRESTETGPLAILAGQRDGFPGIHDAVLEMNTGETRQAVVLPEDAYGPRSEDKVKTYSSVRSLPKQINISREQFIAQYKTSPEKGGVIMLTPYFGHRIVKISGDEVILEADAEDAFVSREEFGDAHIDPEGDDIVITLDPMLGADFEANGTKGRIVSKNEKSFTVDCNSYLAGKTLELEVTVVSVLKASGLKDWGIQWNEDHDEGLNAANETGKPAVLVLYASWCPWSKKVFDETFKDPRVTMFRDEFVWIKADSDKDQGLKELYGQDGFPFIVFMEADGRIIKSLSGFKYAYEMRDELDLALQGMNKVTGDMKKY